MSGGNPPHMAVPRTVPRSSSMLSIEYCERTACRHGWNAPRRTMWCRQYQQLDRQRHSEHVVELISLWNYGKEKAAKFRVQRYLTKLLIIFLQQSPYLLYHTGTG